MIIDNQEKVKSYRLQEQLLACTSSVSMNIAEGYGRNSKKEFIYFLFVSRGSLYEMVTLIHICRKMKLINEIEYNIINNQVLELAKMLNRFITKIKLANNL